MRPMFITAGVFAVGLIATPSQAQTCSSTASIQGFDILAEHKLDVWMFNSEYTDAEAQQIVATIEATLNKMLDKEAAGLTLGRTYLCYRLIHSFDITYRLVDQLTADERNRFVGDTSFHNPIEKPCCSSKPPLGRRTFSTTTAFFPGSSSTPKRSWTMAPTSFSPITRSTPCPMTAISPCAATMPNAKHRQDLSRLVRHR